MGNLEVSYQLLKNENITFHEMVMASGSLRDVYLIDLNDKKFVAKTPKLNKGYQDFN